MIDPTRKKERAMNFNKIGYYGIGAPPLDGKTALFGSGNITSVNRSRSAGGLPGLGGPNII